MKAHAEQVICETDESSQKVRDAIGNLATSHEEWRIASGMKQDIIFWWTFG